MPGYPYCGRCHEFMSPINADLPGQTIWVCGCPAGAQGPDESKDPNCHNSRHEHHDPQSPVVLSSKRIDTAEDEILEDTNQKCDQCLLYGCVWVREGRAKGQVAGGFPINEGDSIEWGPIHCMRCNRLAPPDIPFEPTPLPALPTQFAPRLISHCPHCGGLL